MSEAEKLLENIPKLEPKIYSIRWIIAFLIGVEAFTVRYYMNSMGVVNDIYSEYFGISDVAVDWLTIVQYPGSILANLVVAFLICQGTVGLRRLCIAVAVCSIVTNSTMLLSSFIPTLYPLMYVAKFLLGAAYVMLLTAVAQLANHWFPENEVGKSLLFVPVWTATSSMAAFVIPSNLLYSYTSNHSSFNSSSSLKSAFINATASESQSRSTAQDENLRVFAITSGSLLFISIVCLICIYKFVENQPPEAATQAQIHLREGNSETRSAPAKLKTVQDLKKFFVECKRIMFDKEILVISALGSIRFGYMSMQIILFGEIARPIFSNAGWTVKNPNALSGWVLATYEVAILSGFFLSGKIVDHYKKHVLAIKISFGLGSLFIIGEALGLYFSNVIVLWVFYLLVGVTIGVPDVPMIDLAVQQMFPTKPGLVISLTVLEFYIGNIIIVQINRLVLDYLGSVALLLFLMSLFFIAFILSCFFLRPDLKRTQINS